MICVHSPLSLSLHCISHSWVYFEWWTGIQVNNMATHKKLGSFLATLHEKSRVICHWFFFPASLSDYSCSFTNASRIVQEKRTATPAAAEQVYHRLGALSWLVGPLTWNALMRQSGAIGAWRLAAGRDNLLWDTEQRATKDIQPLVDASLKNPRTYKHRVSHLPKVWALWLVSEQLVFQEIHL